MFSTAKSTTTTVVAAKGPEFTEEGLPLYPALFGTAEITAYLGVRSDPSMQVNRPPPEVVSVPSYLAIPEGTVPSIPRWNVRERFLRALPSSYPLEESSAFVPQASGPVVSARIAAVLEARSIAASYDAPNAKVDCVSESYVNFRVQLHRGRGEYSHGILVEVKRQSGFDSSYARDVYAILDAAEGKVVKDCHDEIPHIDYVVSSESFASSDEEEDMDALECSAGFLSLQAISDILCRGDGNPQDGKDEGSSPEGRDLALSSLASLTSQDSMGPAAARFSDELLASAAHADLRSAVFSNVGQDPLDKVPRRATLKSLEVLANVAASAQARGLLAELLSDRDAEILRGLVVNVENAAHNPRAADLSILALKNVCKSVSLDHVVPYQLKKRLLEALTKVPTYCRDYEQLTEMMRH